MEGENVEKKETPLNFVYVRKGIFSRINWYLIRPLPISEKNSSYILTAMSIASKFLRRDTVSRC